MSVRFGQARRDFSADQLPSSVPHIGVSARRLTYGRPGLQPVELVAHASRVEYGELVAELRALTITISTNWWSDRTVGRTNPCDKRTSNRCRGFAGGVTRRGEGDIFAAAGCYR